MNGENVQRRFVRLATVVVGIWACWRATIGVDFGDGGHAVALALRMAQGDKPFADEMNAQALGSLLAVPFTWLWMHTVGLTGIVLASRGWYLVVAFAAGHVAYRALRTGFAPLMAALAVTVALLPTPYNLLFVSYNTIPLLALVVATTAGFAAVTGTSMRWAAVCGVAMAAAAIAHPAVLPGSLAVGAAVILLSRDRRVAVALLGAAGTAAMVFIVWLVAGIGLDHVRETFRYTADYQELRLPPSTRLELFVRGYVDVLTEWSRLPAWGLVVIACLPALGRRVRAAATAAIPLALTVPTLVLQVGDRRDAIGASSGTFATMAAAMMTVPVALWAAQARRRELLVLLGVALPTAVVNTPLLAMATSASVHWGATVAPVAPLLGVLALGAGVMIAGAWSRPAIAGIAAAGLVVLFLVVQSMYTFRNGTPWDTTERIAGGPNAGLLTTPSYVNLDAANREAMRTWVCPGESILVQGSPTAYLAADAPMDTNIIWLGYFGEANRATVEWFDRSGRRPDVAFIAASYVDTAGGWEALAAADPLVAYLSENYTDRVDDRYFVVLRRRPLPC